MLANHFLAIALCFSRMAFFSSYVFCAQAAARLALPAAIDSAERPFFFHHSLRASLCRFRTSSVLRAAECCSQRLATPAETSLQFPSPPVIEYTLYRHPGPSISILEIRALMGPIRFL